MTAQKQVRFAYRTFENDLTIIEYDGLFLGYTYDEFVARGRFALHPCGSCSRKRVMTVLERFLFRGQEALTVVYYLVDADGSPCPVECTCRASSRDGSGIAVVVEGVIEALNEEAAVLFEQETA